MGVDDPWDVAEPWLGSRGAIIGVADLVDVHWVAACIRYASNEYIDDFRLCSRWAEPDSWHLCWANPRPLPEPIPYRGMLGMPTLPDDVAERVLAGLRGDLA